MKIVLSKIFVSFSLNGTNLSTRQLARAILATLQLNYCIFSHPAQL